MRARTPALLAVLLVGSGALVAASAPVGTGVGASAASADAGAPNSSSTSDVGPTSATTRIDSCTAITEPGRYELVADVENATAGQCIRIRASDVAFDGRGHSVDGTGAFASAGVAVGSWARGVSNVTVRNLRVAEWDDAVRLTNADGGVVADVTAAESRVGVLLLGASGNQFTEVATTDNAVHGVALLDDSDRNRLVGLTAAGNALAGVHLVGDASENLVANVTARGNEFGLLLAGASDNRIDGGEATDNRLAGVWLAAAHDNTVADLRLSNRFYGAWLADGSTGNVLVDNEAIDNAVGFRLRDSDANLLLGNAASGNRDGVLLIESDRTRLVGNRIVDNRRGVALLAAHGTVARNNVVRDNGRNWVYGRGSDRATTTRSALVRAGCT